MTPESIVEVVAIIATMTTTIVTLLIRARLAEQGKDIQELKTYILKVERKADDSKRKIPG